ncbi:MAG: tyrosine-type recombinase/integrase [Pseudomonadota bacterium]
MFTSPIITKRTPTAIAKSPRPARDLRRTCGSWLVQAGRPIHEVSALLRHSDIRVTDKVYAHLAPENLRAAVQTLEETRAHFGHTGSFQGAQNE